MAEAFLQVLLDNLTSFLKGELVLFFGFQKEFGKLSSIFSTIQAVLQDAQEKQLKDKAIENWLQKLNAAAYEVDDILGECKNEAARFEQSRLGLYHPGIITFRHKIGKRMKEIMEKLDAIAEERSKFHFLEKITERQASTRETGFVLTEPEVYGRDKEKDEMVNILINSINIVAEELPVFPIIGIGGLGKTTLAQMIFNDERVTKHFNPKIWVCVSDDFDEKRLIKTIVGNIERSSPDIEDLASFQKKLQELLNGKRYLLVLDDVWNDDPEKWAKLRAVLKVGARGASILATTRLEKVGSIMGTLQPYQLSNLSQEDCWLLFMQRAFGHQKETNPNLMAIGKEIVNKCGGVPLAAKTLGGLLRFKREESEWEHVRDNEIWNLPQDESSILPALRLSYHHLPLNLRQCFVYCAVFPKDTKMEKDNLIALWMAHGFLLSKGNLELEDVGNEVWNELYLRSFFQEIEVKSGNTYFKMHDLIHDLATSLFSASASSSNIREIKRKDYTHMMSIGFAKVVSSYSPSFLKKFVSLRVLNLSYSKLEQLPSSIGDLVHLRYLDLSRNNIRSLPKRLCKLQNLQTLDLRSCYSLSCLPKQTSKLGSLRNLLLDGCPLTSTPPRIGLLTCLKTLDCFIVERKNGYQLGELRNLNLGGSLSITHLERVKKDVDAKEANISAKTNLYSLCMSWDRSDRYESEKNLDEKVLKAFKPHPNMKSLKITGFRGLRLPDWMNGSVLKNVVSIEIGSCKKCLCLPPFGELPCLESLCLFGGSMDVEYVEDNVHDCGRFPSLRRLVIKGFPNLKGLQQKEGKDQFPTLEEMEIHDCPMLAFPTISCVKKLEVWGNTDATTLSSISNLSTLNSLCISHNVEQTSLPEEMFKCLAYLESVSISSFKKLKELPTSLASLNSLKRLEIRRCDSLDSLPEQALEGLTSLKELFVQDCEMLKSLSEGLQHLTALTRLVVAHCPELVALPFGIQNLDSVQSLVIWNCPRLQSLPAGIMEMKNLQALRIVYCPELAKRCEKGIGEDWNKIAHIPNVYIS